MPEPALSIIVIAYNMPREIPRTILSLSPVMQVGVGCDDYEVVLVDNGSTRKFDIERYRSTGINLHVEELPPGDPSPCRAINRGLALARGDLCGVIIDGARLASPGLAAGALRARRLHHRPVISTLGFHLGPDVQMKSIPRGYNQQEEDRLLDSVDWTNDGYRLFDISVFASYSAGGWFAPLSESNALFLTKKLWAELGGYDERFRAPGGGLVNLDTYARACALPDSQLITLLGEGTFHQVHGGIVSNAIIDPWNVFHDEYMVIHGHPVAKPTAIPLLLGMVNCHVLASIFLSAGGSPDHWKRGGMSEASSLTAWELQRAKAIEEMVALIPPGETFILVDQEELGIKELAGSRRRIPFLEREGQYWGPPQDDETAIQELERLRQFGANYVVFCWPAFWWFDYYSGLRHHLRYLFPCILENDRLVVFALLVPGQLDQENRKAAQLGDPRDQHGDPMVHLGSK